MRVGIGKQIILNMRDIQTVYQFDAKYMQFSMYIIVLRLRVVQTLKHLESLVFQVDLGLVLFGLGLVFSGLGLGLSLESTGVVNITAVDVSV